MDCKASVPRNTFASAGFAGDKYFVADECSSFPCFGSQRAMYLWNSSLAHMGGSKLEQIEQYIIMIDLEISVHGALTTTTMSRTSGCSHFHRSP